MTRRRTPRIGTALLGALVLVGLAAAPAAADAPRPTDYRSTVTGVEPALPPGAEVRVVGGDSLLELTMPRGHTAVVADYPTSADEEGAVPYLRFNADGTVERNELAVATTANDSRYGSATDVPDPDAEPRWEQVASDGSYAWHDHRIHWMSPTDPRVVADDGRVDLGGPDGSWTVPLTVDGTSTVITGSLVLVDPPAPAAWALLAAVIAVAAVLVGIRWGTTASTVLGAVTAAGAVLVAVATWRAVPAGAGASVLPVLIAVIALVASVVGIVASRRAPSGRVALVADAAASSAALLGWGLTRWTVLARSVLPTDLDPALDRCATAAAIGVGAGLAVLLVRKPAGQVPAAPAEPVTASPTA